LEPRPEVSLVAWGKARAGWYAYLAWIDVDSWMARSRGGRLSPKVLYTRWVPAVGVRRAVGVDYDGIRRLRLDTPPEEWPAPAVGPDDLPWYGEHRVFPPLLDLDAAMLLPPPKR
jgi:hypothetical protein